MKRSLKMVPCRVLLVTSCLALAACASLPSEPVAVEKVESPPPQQCIVEGTPIRAMLAYYSTGARQSAEPNRDPGALDPYLQMQQAIRYGQMHPPELQKALLVLERVQSSRNPTAVSLSSLARLLQEEYAERLRFEQQLRAANRQVSELQEKIEALSAIEVSLPTRSMPKALRGKQK